MWLCCTQIGDYAVNIVVDDATVCCWRWWWWWCSCCCLRCCRLTLILMIMMMLLMEWWWMMMVRLMVKLQLTSVGPTCAYAFCADPSVGIAINFNCPSIILIRSILFGGVLCLFFCWWFKIGLDEWILRKIPRRDKLFSRSDCNTVCVMWQSVRNKNKPKWKGK